MINGTARNALAKLAAQRDVARAVELQSVPDNIRYDETPLERPTVMGGMISLDPTDYLLGYPLQRLANANKLMKKLRD